MLQPVDMSGYLVSLVIFTCIYALFSLGLNLQWGFTGLINFGYVAFLTVGAYATVLLSLANLPLPIAVVIGGALAALLGLLIGFSTVRLREDYLAIVTIGVSEIIRLIALNEEWLTKGSFGIQNYPLPLENFRPTLFSRLVMIAVLTAILAVVLWRLAQWLRLQLKGKPFSAIVKSAAGIGLYLLLLAALVFSISLVFPVLVATNAAAGLLTILVLAALGGIIWLSIWLGRRWVTRLPAWEGGLILLTALFFMGFGLWIYGVCAVALFNYSQNPARNGLMFVSIGVLAFTFWALERLVRSPWGRVLKAIREDEAVAKALGKNVFWYKLQSLMIGGFIGGVAGALFAWQLSTIYPENFQPLITFNAWTIVVLGGAGNNGGTILGAIIFWAYTTGTRFLDQIIPLDDSRLGALRIMLIGLLLIVLMMWRPQGLLGKQEELTLGQ
ncbi:MAG TPA: branched-chain amino acid ABC transporter permease [Coleofasciculaceae cyanobacterium]